jgi:hypothetical protein
MCPPVTVHFGHCEEGSSVCEWEVYSGQHHISRELETLKSWGEKTGRCSGREKEMQITQTQSVKVLHSKPPAVLVETRWCIVLFINIWFLIIWLLKWLFCLECSIYRYM